MPTIFKASPKKHTPSVKSKTHDEPHAPAREQVQTRMTPLTYFAINPAGLRFETQQEDETVILFLRQHFIVNFGWIVLTLVLIAAPTLLFPLFMTQLDLPFVLPGGYIFVGTVFWYVASFGFALANFIRWYFNIYIVTNERIVDIDFVHLLYKEFSEARIVSIQDMTYRSSGALATVFHFGDVFIQTAGNTPRFEFVAVPKPDRVVQTLSELVEKQKKAGGV